MLNKVYEYVRKVIEELDSQRTQPWIDEEKEIKKLSKKFSNQDLYNASYLRFKVKDNKIMVFDDIEEKEVCIMTEYDTPEMIKEEFFMKAEDHLWNTFYDKQKRLRLEICFDELHKETGILDFIYSLLQPEVEGYYKNQYCRRR
ncbi:hypothetical protein SDC9_157321 [bioreactor metagenome]|uniref:Uncharacterized protein n=1 Tax=bioreactor metagenome TaxID=1076179 RepID=A0A645F6N0_9ZZZZ